MERKFKVVKKSAGYSVKSFATEDEAKAFADKCSKANFGAAYIVCTYNAGILQELTR